MSLTDQLVQAIARFEGFLVSGSVAQRNNNPGNLRSGPGQIGTDANGYAIFPDVATGQAALANQINLNISRGLSLNEFFAGQRDAEGNLMPGGYPGYAPSADKNNPVQYAATVAGWIGIDPTVPLNSLGGSQASPGASPGTSFPSVILPPADAGASAGLPDVLSEILDTSGGITPVAIGALVLLGIAAIAVLRS
jgi:hypothetical protein